MAINFPDSPTTNQISVIDGISYLWNGTYWTALNTSYTGLTASKALVTDASGIITVAGTTSTQIGYLSTTTSDVQTQLNNKLSLSGGTLTGSLTINNNSAQNDKITVNATTGYLYYNKDGVLGTFSTGSDWTISKTGAFTGNAATATSATTATTATLAPNYLPLAGGTMSGRIVIASTGFHAGTKDNITTRTDSGFFQTNTATTAEGWPETTNDWYHLLSSTHTNDSNYYSMQLASPFYSNKLYYRSTNGNGSTSWGQVAVSNSSGIYDIRIDSQALVDQNNTIVTSGKQPTHNVWAAPIEIREIQRIATGQLGNDYAPALRFHWSLRAATALKMYGDGSIRVTAQSDLEGQYQNFYALNGIFTGNVTAYASDERLKRNFKSINNAIEKVSKISGYTFDWDIELCESLGFTPDLENEHGVKAQEIQQIVPDAVTLAPFDTDTDNVSRSGNNYLTVRYERLVPLLIEAIKEQNDHVKTLEERIEILEKIISTKLGD